MNKKYELLQDTTGEEFQKHDTGKPRFDLIPPHALLEIAKVAAYGAKKYAPNNWMKCEEPGRYLAAAYRHMNAYQLEEWKDGESDLHHLAHAAWSLMAEYYIHQKTNVDLFGTGE